MIHNRGTGRVLFMVVVTICLSVSGFSATGSDLQPICGTFPGRRHLARATHDYLMRVQARRRAVRSQSSLESVGNIVLFAADGSIVAEPNPFDLRGASLSFEPLDGGTRYRLVRGAEVLESALGEPLALGDDDTQSLELPFEFLFFGRLRNRVFVNSDGNLTFDAGDDASSPRSVGRFLTGPPRIAILFNDFDPSVAGTVRAAILPDRLVVSWEAVPEYDRTNRSSFQVSLEATGHISFRFGDPLDADQGVVGISPGGGPDEVHLVDLNGEPVEHSGAVVENFLRVRTIDHLAVARRFLGSFPDAFDSIVVWTNFDSDEDDAFAFEITIRNDVRGIGIDRFDDASLWGSGGELESYVFMGEVGNYPSLPEQPILRTGGRPTTLGLLSHEVGHRWLVQVRFDDNGRFRDELLGRQMAHWSFFFDSDASFLEGNDIEQEGERSFRTVGSVARYSTLDLYLMGLAGPEEVAPLFYIGNGRGEAFGEPLSKETPPQQNIVITGDRQAVLIDDIIRAEGPRRPDFASSQKMFRQAWIFLFRESDPPGDGEIERVEAARAQWEAFFQQTTLGRAVISTELAR